MAPKKNKSEKRKAFTGAVIENAGVVIDQPITETLKENYMPYAMSVIVSRAIPEIDGFKPSHRKLLYTMYKMGLLSGSRTKSANIVGQTMRLNPHGDATIYETMVRLSRGNEALLYPFVDSKGNFGKAYSRDMAYAASRYTEAKLDSICEEVFKDIDKDTVDFIDNYDATTKEPVLLPVSFPTVLVNANTGIAVGMASSICPFNLAEVCETTIELIKNPQHNIISTLKGPDFPGGGYMLYKEDDLQKIYETGRGSIKVRARYNYDKANNCIEVTQIPPTTTIEAIIEKTIDLAKSGKIKEISDVRDETDLSGLKITFDLKRGVDPDRLMQKLYKSTPLEDSFVCNFNVLIAGMPKVLGVRELLMEWVAYRAECIKRKLYFDLVKMKDKLHLLSGLKKILLDIDKAIKIVRETDEEKEVVPNLMIGFGIDEIQADYVAEIKLRHLNREYILKRTSEIDELKKQIAETENILKSESKLRNIIVKELGDIAKKYAKPRKTLFVFPSDEKEEDIEDEVENYSVNVFFTSEGYFKKITPQSLRMSGAQKLKEGDEVVQAVETTNTAHLLFFTNMGQVYKSTADEFEDTKASVLGEYIPAKLGMDEGETAVYMAVTQEYKGHMVFVYQNGKVAKVPLSSYETKQKRRKLLNAYNTASPLAAMFAIEKEEEILLTSTAMRMLLVYTGKISEKIKKDTAGIAVMTLKKGKFVDKARIVPAQELEGLERFKTRTLPAAGTLPKADDLGEQIKF